MLGRKGRYRPLWHGAAVPCGKWYLDIVFGEGVFEEMISTVIHILMVIGVIIILLILLSIWRIITKNKIKKAILLISEYPDSEHTCIFLSRINNISKFGKFLAKMGFGFCGLSKGECRTILIQPL